MAMKVFAAIDVGSYHVCMNIYEIAVKSGIRQVEELRSRLEIGRETYGTGKISYETTEELCRVLKDFVGYMKEYQVDDYRACATSTLREAQNVWIVLDQVYQRTGINVEILSNSQQRFYGYKSVAAKEASFAKMIQKGTAIVEIGGGNVQISLFDKDALVTTQSFRMGSMRIRERLLLVEKETIYYERLVEELIHNEVLSFKKLHLKERKIDNVILLGDMFLETVLRKLNALGENRTITMENFMDLYRQVVPKSPEQVAMEFGYSAEFTAVMIPTMIILRVFLEEMGAEILWLPGTQLNDGLSYDYAQHQKLIKSRHNFENDILVSAKNIAKRYLSNKNHTQAVGQAALTIYDSMKRVHGMESRERLLLEIAVILHDCGKYISMSNSAQCAYEIIMATEIIGLSNRERELIANVVRFNTEEFRYYNEAETKNTMNRDTYMLIGKLTAIMRVANVLDRSHKQKAEVLKAVLKDRELILTVDTQEDLTLEEGLLQEKAGFFEEVFSIKPILRKKRR